MVTPRGNKENAWRERDNAELTMEESIRMAEDRDKWRNYVHGVANSRIEDG